MPVVGGHAGITILPVFSQVFLLAYRYILVTRKFKVLMDGFE